MFVSSSQSAVYNVLTTSTGANMNTKPRRSPTPESDSSGFNNLFQPRLSDGTFFRKGRKSPVDNKLISLESLIRLTSCEEKADIP